MTKINWQVRFKNKQFWLAAIPAALLLIQLIAKMFGFELNLDEFQANLLNVVNALFVLLAILGITVDMTTPGVGDSEIALMKTEPVDLDLGTVEVMLMDDAEELL